MPAQAAGTTRHEMRGAGPSATPSEEPLYLVVGSRISRESAMPAGPAPRGMKKAGPTRAPPSSGSLRAHLLPVVSPTAFFAGASA